MSPTTTRRSGREPSSFVTVSAVLLGARGRPSKRPTVSLNERERVAHWRTAVGGDTALPSTAIGADDDLPSPPGSPVRLPGGWISKGKGRAAEATEDGLALPPPFLDESSTPESFESLLGVRRQREDAARQRRIQRQLDRDRPPSGAFPAPLLHTVSKLGSILSPPASPMPSRPSQLDRRVSRSERSMRGLEVGERLGERIAQRLRATDRNGSSSRLEDIPPMPLSLSPLPLAPSRPPCRPLTPSALMLGHADRSPPPLAPPKLGIRLSAIAADEAMLSPMLLSPTPADEGDYFGASVPTTREPSPQPLATPIRSASWSTWLLVGSSSEGVGRGVVGVVSHAVGFVWFVVAHVLDLAVATACCMRAIALSVYWIYLNASGRTDLGLVARKYSALIRREWATVAAEDGESLSTLAIVFGLLELAAIQAMTHEIYVRAGEGRLTRLELFGAEVDEDDSEAGEGLLITDDADGVAQGTVMTPSVERRYSLPPISPRIVPQPADSLTHERSSRFIRAIKRNCRFATASYGLHSLIVAPSTPLFTPSGANLPSHVFAHLGKIRDKSNVLHVALQRDYSGGWSTDAEPKAEWEPSFYLIRDHDHRAITVVFRGTQSLHDLVVDLTADEEALTLPDGRGGQAQFVSHGGILRAAQRLIDPATSPLLAKVDAALQENDGYALVLCGHSLGAACASLVAALIATRDPGDVPNWRLNEKCGLPAGRPIRAMCFGQPPIVDADLAALCASGGDDALVTSVSLGNDIIPRIGIVQLREMRRSIGVLARLRRGVLERRRKADADQAGTHASGSVLKSWWRWRRTAVGSDERATLEAAAWDIRRELDFHLRRRATLEPASVRLPPGRAIHLERDPIAVEGVDGPEERWIAHTVDDPRSFFAVPWLTSDCIAAHMPRFHADAMDTL